MPENAIFSAINNIFGNKINKVNNVKELPDVTTTPSVEVLTLKDYKKAARTLQIAFQDDLYVDYLTSGIKDSKLKEQMNIALFEATAYSTILSGLLLGVRDIDGETVDPDAPFLAVACFQKPVKKDQNSSTYAENRSLFSYLWRMYQGGYLSFVWKANKETRQRVFNEQWELLDKYREEVLASEFNYSWYLSDIGAISRGRGKGLARMLVDYACSKYIDVYKDEDEDLNSDDKTTPNEQNVSSDEESKIDSEIQSFNFQFDLDSDNLTDYSGYSSFSDSESTHSSWYYNEEDDILTKYDRQQQSKGKHKGATCYLESSHPRNRKIYQKLGFTYVKTVQVAEIQKGNEVKVLMMDLMVRGIKGAKWQTPN